MMRILLLQLPIQTHDFFFSRENIPLAAGYLRVIASELGMEAEILPSHLMCYGSDQAIVKYVADARPDLVGMSCYLWNVERSLFLSREIKSRLPECRIVLGGPEVTSDNALLFEKKPFDVGVVGEGEGSWKGLLQSFPQVPEIPGLLLPGKKRENSSSEKGLARPPLRNWSSPYLCGALDSHLQRVLWLETVRGCVYRCAYCYYHKQSPTLRVFPFERVLHEIKKALEQGVQEIVFLDPCFTRRPQVGMLLDAIASINGEHGLRLQAETTVEGIDPALAGRMAKAGFVEIEAGLQSTHQKTLRRIHRSFRPQLFLDGFRSLQEQGIEVMVDLIAGLPGDGLSDICRSMDWVLEQEAYDYLMLYPLSLMPSTELKQRAEELGLISMPYPPYLLTRGPGLTAEEMCAAFRYYEECMEEDISPLEMPLPLNPKAESSGYLMGLCNLVNWHSLEQVKSFGRTGGETAYALTISMAGEVLERPGLWSPILREYLGQNPFSLISVEVPSDACPEDLELLWRFAREHNHPADRDYTVTHTPYRSFFLYSREKGLTWKWPDPREFFPSRLHDGQEVNYPPEFLAITSEEKVPRWFPEQIRKWYPQPPGIRLWQDPED